MATAVDTPGACAVYRRRPERTPLYRAVQGHLQAYLALAEEAQGEGVPPYVEREFRCYLECGILAHREDCFEKAIAVARAQSAKPTP